MKQTRAPWSVVLLFLGAAALAQAEPTSDLVSVVSLRPYIGDSMVYIEVDSDALCGTLTFTIDTSQPNGKEVYAAAMTALTTGKKVRLEVPTSIGCKGWGSKLQSIYIYR
ncbi:MULTISPECIES: hypothetical protein [unclassified Xanthomonas]|uniref:hypothetical protein n=1 Tax=unclassified Xanthomonas TaxID=2643310 RepID=UPI0005BE0944|nr:MULTISPECIES: hypothetical protein [unclassified Xanthomonas]